MVSIALTAAGGLAGAFAARKALQKMPPPPSVAAVQYGTTPIRYDDPTLAPALSAHHTHDPLLVQRVRRLIV